ncbi:HepT-like ribonuclease domain-containing protein [Sulfolobus tengchongensis]|uniref:HepT-like ribonuclease domain-containing protein n=1 Tax=Sulfolobus tengchongensis TaxID=207809 RepID=A0AAX4L306_9CREN
MTLLDKLLEMIKDYTIKLDEIKSLDDWITYYATLHLLQVQAQAFIDLVRRILSNMGITTDSYKESIKKLFELNLITEGEYSFLSSVVSFRNIVIHGYATVNQHIVYKIMKEKSYRRLLEIAEKLREKGEKYWDP